MKSTSFVVRNRQGRTAQADEDRHVIACWVAIAWGVFFVVGTVWFLIAGTHESSAPVAAPPSASGGAR